MIKIDKNTLLNHQLNVESGLDLSEYLGEIGKEHYRLLSWMSLQFNHSTLIDIGTHHGASAAALSSNLSNTVHSFDITDKGLRTKKSNCVYHQLDLWDDKIREEWKIVILSSPLIFLHIDPHEGTMEYEFYTWLCLNNYKGILILDDIWYFEGMRNNLWYKISTNKIDATTLGHWSGTGIVDFSNNISIPECQYETSNWTLVTAYFDLTKEPDASEEIKARPSSHYLKNAYATMGVEQNLVVFCDETTKPLLEKLRPDHLKHKTKFILTNFGDFELVSNNREIVQENRVKNPYYFDKRNTASYYLFCMLRYVMVQQVIDQNPFQSTHFAWVNVCIERMGWRNVSSLNEALSLYRDKFSTCWIDYQPEQLVNNLKEYFLFGRCGMCSGFFTGRYDYFTIFNKNVLQEFKDCLEKGYGHADEQLYSIVYFKNPSIFHPYFGDYTEMITNYVEVRDRVTEPVRNLISNSFTHKRYDIAMMGCESVWKNRHKLPHDYLVKYLQIFMYSIIMTRQFHKLDFLRDEISIYLI